MSAVPIIETTMRSLPRVIHVLVVAGLLTATSACTDGPSSAAEAVASASFPRASAPPPRTDGESPAARDFRAFALNALLVPLLDPELESPSRWADPSFSMACLDASVTVDGERPDIDAAVPDRFTVRWALDRCTPLGPNVELSGRVTLHVEAGVGGYVARVVPDGLTLHSQGGVDHVTDAFTAHLPIRSDAPSVATASASRGSPGS